MAWIDYLNPIIFVESSFIRRLDDYEEPVEDSRNSVKQSIYFVGLISN